MNANLTDAELAAAMGDPNADLTAGVQRTVEQPGRRTPASDVCYMNLDKAQEPPAHRSTTPYSEPGQEIAAERHSMRLADLSLLARDESDNTTPRSEVPSTMDESHGSGPTPEPGYFSPRPLRVYGSKLPASTPTSTNPSPTTSLNVSTTSVNRLSDSTVTPSTPADQQDRPIVYRDHSTASTATVATIRPHSVDPIQTASPSMRQHRDGPTYPNQSYAALHSQYYPTYRHAPTGGRGTRGSMHSHFPSLSAAHITTIGLPQEYHRELIDAGSRTVGNSPASSPGLFSPTTSPLSHNQQLDDGSYSSPYLHHTHRHAPKETHIADVDVDPVSGRKIINQYEIIDELGRGVHGKVKLGRNLETGDNVAIKIVDRFSKRRRLGKNTSHEDKIKREIAILKKARHPNIVSLLEVIDDPKRKKVYIVLEHVELGEVRWRTLGEKEITLIEWRRYQRESQGIFDNESAALEDKKIIALAHQRLEREQRRRQRLLHNRRRASLGNEPWSLELGGESDDDSFEGSRQSRASIYGDDRISRPHRSFERRDENSHIESNMETAVRVPTPTSTLRQADSNAETGLEGTMYGAYETEMLRGRTPSVAESSSSHFTDEDDAIPEPFTYVPLLTMQAARETFRDTVLGLEYLHFQNVVHRDIKPANLLQTKEHRIKISDFGVSYLGRNPQPEEANGDLSESDYPDVDEAIELAKTVGTPAFYAPELCQTDLAAEPLPVDKQIDVWALGVTLYCLIYGRVPFHAEGPFGMMKAIAEEECYIPTLRLKAVAEQSGSRPNSHGRPYQSMTSNKRAPHDLEYEEVPDILLHLLRRLLTKDPRKRITIKEIKLHPWLLEGIENFPSWVEETDPSRSSQGRKIEVSNEDVEKAVVPITLIDRVRSGVRKTLESVFTMGRRGGSRRRAQSTATDQPQSISAHSSSSTISQEGRRPSLAINQSIFEALSRSREPEHPLSQSVTASPEASERTKYFEGPDARTASPAHCGESHEHLAPLASSTRPTIPERAHSAMSSAASIRTVRASDLARSGRPVSPNIPPALPGTPTALDTPGGHNLGGIFGGVPRRFVNSVRSREHMLKLSQEPIRAQSIDRLGGDDDAHSGPSIALSTTSVEGHVQDVLSDLSPTVARGSSPSLSELQSPDPTERASSRQSSISSASSYRNRTYATHNQIEASSTLEPSTYLRQREPYEETWNRAKDDFRRRRVLEENQGRDRAVSMNAQRPASALGQTECPPSPDDEDFFRRQRHSDYFEQAQHVSPDTHLVGYPSQTTALTSSSSEDQFASMSQSTSNRSIPSVASANSSVAPDECFDQHTPSAAPSAESMNQFLSPTDDPAGYDGDGDHVLESEDEESDEEDFIIMGKKKKNLSLPPRSGSISNAELARASLRKEYLSERRRSARSGSNGTVKKVEPPGGSDPEGQH